MTAAIRPGKFFHRSVAVKLLLGIFLFVTVICPLAAMLMNMAGQDI
jgi:hypothetical protein